MRNAFLLRCTYAGVVAMCFEVGVLACLVVCARLLVAAAVVVFCVRFFKYRSIRLAAASRSWAALSCTCWGIYLVLCVVPRALECLAYFVHNRSFVLDWLTILVGDRTYKYYSTSRT